MLPQASVAEQVTCVVPIGNVDPLGGVHVTVTSRASSVSSIASASTSRNVNHA
jgi:hypothetical protein